MQITPDLIKYLESLARITLTEKEEEKVGAELQDILTYIDMLNELDTDNVEAMSHSFPITNVFREDEVKPSLSPDEMQMHPKAATALLLCRKPLMNKEGV